MTDFLRRYLNSNFSQLSILGLCCDVNKCSHVRDKIIALCLTFETKRTCGIILTQSHLLEGYFVFGFVGSCAKSVVFSRKFYIINKYILELT